MITLEAAEQAATSELARAALRHAADELAGDSSGHDPSHVLRVFRSAQGLARAEGADLERVEIIAALHDLKDFKFTGDTSTGPHAAYAWLIESGADEMLATGVANDIAGISFKGAGTPLQPLSLEGGCVQDADRLDALGAIGIARCFAYGGHVGRPLFDPSVPTVNHTTVESYLQTQGTSLNHFYEKLFLLRSRMNTATAKNIADARHEFMEKFVAQFLDEWNGKDSE
ncbi:HD domain-containing protein [Actinophytocola sp.]|uniref:HD domain-containing protein n=1 Tax=Actinophytocola sp. TaxID=1872138 RepID=UPI00389AE769